MRPLRSAVLKTAHLLLLAGSAGTIAAAANSATAASAPPAHADAAMTMVRTQGARWVRSDGSAIELKGANLGNWLIPEFWMMGQGSAGIDDQCKLEATLDARFGRAERERLFKLFRDNWITRRDWDLLPQFGLNLVRLPFIWSLLEDETNPRHLRTDAWHYLDAAIAAAEVRGLYVILDLHGAAGGQGTEHHSGCAGKNLYWSRSDNQERTIWLWQQIAARYKDRAAVAGYSLLNEPWGAGEAEIAATMKKLYASVRAVDPHHVIILPGHFRGIDAYGKPQAQGLVNVAFEMHFYPGFFGWGEPGVAVHRNWLQCLPSGGICDWKARMAALDAPLFVGEFQPWAEMQAELGGQITRASFDSYARQGWAAAVWSYKWISNDGGPVKGNWGLVTNADGERVPALDFTKASLADIEALFKRFGSVAYRPNAAITKWMNSEVAPEPFKRP